MAYHSAGDQAQVGAGAGGDHSPTPITVALHIPQSQLPSAAHAPDSDTPSPASGVLHSSAHRGAQGENGSAARMSDEKDPAPAPVDSAAGAGAGAGATRIQQSSAGGQPILTALQHLTADALAKDYDLVCVPLTNAHWRARWEEMCLKSKETEEEPRLDNHGEEQDDDDAEVKASSEKERQEKKRWRRERDLWRVGGRFRRGEVNVTRLEETEALIGLASDWLDLDSPDASVRLDSELALRQEISYASYLAIPTLVVPPPRSLLGADKEMEDRKKYLNDYARAINVALAESNYLRISVRLPLLAPPSPSPSSSPLTLNDKQGLQDRANAVWEAWDTIRSLSGYSGRLGVALDLGLPMPPLPSLARWNAEPVRQIWLSAHAYIPNAHGYPVLSKDMQAFLRGAMKQKPTVILSSTHRRPPSHSRGGQAAYIQYVRHLERTASKESAVEDFARGYMDWLQAPLQPLMDNLESSTYEVFERDPIKYARYEEAVYRALSDRPSTSMTVIYVCGAGRGPLVARCLSAAERAVREVKVVAVEKNPNAFVTLQERKANEWGSSVELIFADMRTLLPPAQKADIVVSELLGSFGDNELSPECLDGAMRFLKPDGISIPRSYTAYLSPVSSSKLHSEVAFAAGSPSPSRSVKSVETPYVVMFQAVSRLSASGGRGDWEDTQECWQFVHGPLVEGEGPLRDMNGLPVTNHHNNRSTQLTFHIPYSGVVHGLAGYFEATLYDDVTISIHPDPRRGSKDMLSWFPIWFPFREPLYVPPNSELDVSMWRLTDGRRKVWYEWSAEAYLSVPAAAAAAASTRRSEDLSLAVGVPMSPTTAQRSSRTSSNGPHNRESSTTWTNSTPTGSDNYGEAFKNARLSSQARSWGGAAGVEGIDASGGSANAVDGAAAALAGTRVARLEGGEGAEGEGEWEGGGGDEPRTPSWKRIKVGMTGLMNPGGRSSWIGL